MSKEFLRQMIASAGWPMILLAGRGMNEPRVAVIMYHSVGGNAKMSLSPSAFSHHIDALQDMGAKFATVGEICGSREVSDWTICLTFDDGFEDNHSVVFPLLVNRGIRATFFLCSGFVDRRIDISARFRNYRGLSPMNWQQARELADAGMEIGCHTVSHPVLATLPAIMQEQEMANAKKEIENQVGIEISSFAIPFGNRGTYTGETLDIAARYFRVCCTTRFSTNASRFYRHREMVLFDRIEPRPSQSPRQITDQGRGRWDALRWIQRPYRGTK